MKATTTIAVARCGGRNVVVDQRSEAPVSVRQCGDRILLAQSAAAPVGGDELELSIRVGEGAHVDIGSVAANMVWPGPSDAMSVAATRCTIDAGGHLELRLEPTISVAGSHHRAQTTVSLTGTATCRLVEELSLGRTGEPSGRLDLSLRIERDGVPLLHHDEAFGPGVAGELSSVSVRDARFVIAAVVVGPESGSSRSLVEGVCAGAWLPIAADAGVALVIGPDRPAAVDMLERVAGAELAAAPEVGRLPEQVA